MDLVEAKMKLQELDNAENYYLNEKEIIQSIVLPKGIQITPDKISGGKRVDKMLKYVEMLDETEIDKILTIINRKKKNLMNYIDNELIRIGEYQPLAKKIYDLRYDKDYKENHNGKLRSFTKIGNITGYSSSQCCRILQRMLSKRNV